MTLFLLSFIILLILVAGMSIGVLFGRKPIAGSCGGMKTLGMDTGCEVCGGDKNKCEKTQPKNAKADDQLAYDATKSS